MQYIYRNFLLAVGHLHLPCSEFLKQSTQRTQVGSRPQSLQEYVGSPILNTWDGMNIDFQKSWQGVIRLYVACVVKSFYLSTLSRGTVQRWELLEDLETRTCHYFRSTNNFSPQMVLHCKEISPISRRNTWECIWKVILATNVSQHAQCSYLN